MKTLQQVVPSIVLALGTVAGTALAVLTTDAGWWVMAGPVVLAVAIVGACVLGRRWSSHPAAGLTVSIVVALIFTLAALIVAIRDTTRVPSLIPIFGGGAIVVLVRPRRCSKRRLSVGADA